VTPEPLTITITVSGPQGSGKTTLLDALVNLLHDNKINGRPSAVMPRAFPFRLLQSNSYDDCHTVQFKGFHV